MKKYIFQILLLLILVCIMCFGCGTNKVITGEIKAVYGDTVELGKHRFKVLKNVPQINSYCTFTATKDTSKVNCIKLK